MCDASYSDVIGTVTFGDVTGDCELAVCAVGATGKGLVVDVTGFCGLTVSLPGVVKQWTTRFVLQYKPLD